MSSVSSLSSSSTNTSTGGSSVPQDIHNNDRPTSRNIDKDVDTSHHYDSAASDATTTKQQHKDTENDKESSIQSGRPTTQLPPGASDAIDMSRPPYERYYKACSGNPPSNSTIRLIVGTFMCFLISSLYYVVPISFIVCLIGSVFLKPWCIIGLLTLITLGCTPLPSKETAKYYRNHWVMRTVAEYFNLRWIEDTPISTFSTKEHYISVWVPHGIIPFAGIAVGPMFDAVAPEYYGRSVQQPIVTRLPGLRQLFSVFRSVKADKHSLMRVLKRGDNISIWTGGLAELFVSDPNREIIYMKTRKGFVKLAITSGSHITPYYCFGNNHMFTSTNASAGEKSLLATLSRKIGASLTFFWGRYFLPLPYRTPVTVVRGRKIEVKQSDHPSQEEIERVHSEVVETVKGLHEKYKHVAGPQHANKTLIVR